MISYFFSRFRTIDLKTIKKNINGNWFIPFSALFYLILITGMPTDSRLMFDSYISVGPALLMILCISLICEPVSLFFRRTTKGVRGIALFSALGVCYSTWMVMTAFPLRFTANALLVRTISMILAIPFIFVVCLLFWEVFVKTIRMIINEANVKKYEVVVYVVLLLIFIAYISFCFLSTQAFYGTNHSVDIIYTSDSPKLVRLNAYIVVDHIENDIRQPLLAIFSAPLMGIPCLIGNLIPGVPMALILDYAQAGLLLFTAFILAVALRLDSVQRICFVLVSSATYTYLLFSLMMEQYITAVFWLVMTVFFFAREKEARMLSFAASGTLLTSGALVPFIFRPDRLSGRSILGWLKQILFYGLDFLLILVIAGRTHIVCNSIRNLVILKNFAGEKVSLSNRVLQYFSFVSGCFFASDSSEELVNNQYKGWHLSEVTSLNYLGLFIFILAIVAFVFTRKEMFSRISFLWICFSVVVIVIVGWGTQENGLILYSLYFGWAFLALIFNLLKDIEGKLKSRFIIPVIAAMLCIVLLIYNIPAVIDMLKFAIQEYPI